MSGYSIALVLHLFALFAAFGAGTVLHLAMLQVRPSMRGRDALPWLGIAHRFARVFPVAIAVLVASGAWMVHASWAWSDGFVDAGLAAVVLLGLLGDVVAGRRGAAIARQLAAAPERPAGEIARDRAWWWASFGNTGLALGVVVVMVAKPSLGLALAVLAAGALLGAGAGEIGRRSRADGVAAAAVV